MKTSMFIISLLTCLFLGSCDEKLVNTKTSADVADVADVVYPANIETSDLQYPDSCIKYPYLQPGTYLPVVAYIINSQEELDLHLLGCEETRQLSTLKNIRWCLYLQKPILM
jgi:hypothetical protein